MSIHFYKVCAREEELLTVRNPTSAPVYHWMRAGLKVFGLVAGPPITVSLKVSAPMLMLGASQAVMFLGYKSKGGEKVEDVKVCSP
jgi:hypothetical protein